MEPLLHCFVFLHLVPSLMCQTVDNNVVGDPKVDCTGEQVGITFSTEKAFTGRVFVLGYAAQKDCVMTGTDRPPGLSLGFSQCGVQRSRQLSPPGMIVYTTVVISFHPIFVTKLDRAYRVACHYMEASRSVTADLDVSMLSTAAMTSAPQMPECRYEILVGGPTGHPARYVKVGEQIYHKWTCDSKDNAYCMRVHSCSADDGQGTESYMVVDSNGCSTDRFVLQNLEYITDLTAGQETHVFKFADKASLYFSCQIELLSKASESADCVSARPNCSEPSITEPNLSVPAPAPAPAPISAPAPVSVPATVPSPPPASSTPPVSAPATSAAPAPAARDARRRVVRDERGNMNQSSSHNDFQVLGNLDLMRQHLTVFDLDDTTSTDDPSRNPDGSTTQLDDASDGTGTGGLLSPICVSPIGFGIAVFGLLSLFVIAFWTAMRYAAPVHRFAHTTRKVITPDRNVHTLPRYLPFRGQ